jgi:hypothetical protein
MAHDSAARLGRSMPGADGRRPEWQLRLGQPVAGMTSAAWSDVVCGAGARVVRLAAAGACDAGRLIYRDGTRSIAVHVRTAEQP